MTTRRMTLTFDKSNDDDLGELLAEIAEQAGEDDAGMVKIDGGYRSWDLHVQGEGCVNIDRRQRLVAVKMLMGFDLPQEMGECARSMREAAALLPGLMTSDFHMGSGGRQAALKDARALIDEMLAEMGE